MRMNFYRLGTGRTAEVNIRSCGVLKPHQLAKLHADLGFEPGMVGDALGTDCPQLFIGTKSAFRNNPPQTERSPSGIYVWEVDPDQEGVEGLALKARPLGAGEFWTLNLRAEDGPGNTDADAICAKMFEAYDAWIERNQF